MPFTIAGVTLADLFDHQTQGKTLLHFASTAFVAIGIGPVTGCYVGQSGLDWPWTEWIILCISSGLLVLVVFAPEMYGLVILTWKAETLSSSTGNESYKSSLEITEATLIERLRFALTRPFAILFSQPIVFLFTIYLTFLYIVSFSLGSSFPNIFGEQGVNDLDQDGIAIIVGIIPFTLIAPLFGLLAGIEAKKAAKKAQSHPRPEAILWCAMISIPMLPNSILWLAWTAYKGLSHWSAIV